MNGPEMKAILVELEWPQNELARRLHKAPSMITKWSRFRNRKLPHYVEAYLVLALTAKRAGVLLNRFMQRKRRSDHKHA